MLSFSMAIGSALTLASQLINDLFPVYLIPFGITLGLGILAMLVKALRGLDIGRRY